MSVSRFLLSIFSFAESELCQESNRQQHRNGRMQSANSVIALRVGHIAESSVSLRYFLVLTSFSIITLSSNTAFIFTLSMLYDCTD
jgi:hypothetical protein